MYNRTTLIDGFIHVGHVLAAWRLHFLNSGDVIGKWRYAAMISRGRKVRLRHVIRQNDIKSSKI